MNEWVKEQLKRLQMGYFPAHFPSKINYSNPPRPLTVSEEQNLTEQEEIAYRNFIYGLNRYPNQNKKGKENDNDN